MSKTVEQIRSCVRGKDPARALSLLKDLGEASGLPPNLLVLKAQCLLLSEGASLEDVEATLLRAIEIDEEYVEAFIELGWFRLNVKDDAPEAKLAFDRAIDLLRRQSAQAIRGDVACEAEIHPNADVNDFRDALRDQFLDGVENG